MTTKDNEAFKALIDELADDMGAEVVLDVLDQLEREGFLERHDGKLRLAEAHRQFVGHPDAMPPAKQ